MAELTVRNYIATGEVVFFDLSDLSFNCTKSGLIFLILVAAVTCVRPKLDVHIVHYWVVQPEREK